MDILEYLIKILIILLSVFAMAVPFLFSALRVRMDKTAKTRHKHLRVVVFAVVYCIVLTVVLALIEDFYKQIETWAMSIDLLRRLAELVAVSDRVKYCATVFGAILLNVGVGLLYLVVQNLARIGLKKKDLSKPGKKNGTFTRFQALERYLIGRINNETGKLAARILKAFNIAISVIYLVMFALFQIPALSEATWIPYAFLASLFKSGYMLPVLTMLPLWELYWLLSGIQLTREECPALEGQVKKQQAPPPDLDAARDECESRFEGYHVVDFSVPPVGVERPTANNDHPITDLIAQAIKNDQRFGRDPDAAYLNAVDKLLESKVNLIVKGSLFSEFGMYFVRYLNMILAQGGTLIFLCSSDEEIRATHDYLSRALSVVAGLYFVATERTNTDLDIPIWGISRVCNNCDMQDENAIDDRHILITTPDYICSPEFETKHEDFIRNIHDVILVNTYAILSMHAPRLSMMNTRFLHIIKYNVTSAAAETPEAANYQARPIADPIRYLCFDDSNIPGLDRVLRNLIDPPRRPGQDASTPSFKAVDCMSYRENTQVVCFNYGPPRGADGVAREVQLIPTKDHLASVFNMAYLFLTKGFGGVYLYTEDAIPYRGMIDSALSNDARLVTEFDNARFHLNQYAYDPDDYDVIVAIDGSCNLPATVRRYANLAGDRKVLINVVSKPYMLRDYYAANIESLWETEQSALIPVCDRTARDTALRILVKTNSGGITEEELFRIALSEPSFEEMARAHDTQSIIQRVLSLFDVANDTGDAVFDHFEFATVRDFNDSGTYCHNTRLRLRQQGKLYDFLEGRNLVRLTTKNNVYTLPLPKSRISQRYISQQNLLYDGTLYRINAIDARHGVIDVLQATGGQNIETYDYIQNRLYRVELSADPNTGCTQLYPPKHIMLNGQSGEVSVSDVYVSVWRAPTEVITLGYTALDPHTFERNDNGRKHPGSGCQYVDLTAPGNRPVAMQAYRRYGALKDSYYKTDRDQNDFIRYGAQLSELGAQMLSIRICGKFGGKGDRIACLAATAMGELMRTIFPDLCDSIAIVPVLRDATLLQSGDGETIGRLQPQLELTRDDAILADMSRPGVDPNEQETVELMLIEDCSSDLGVISMMIEAGTSPMYQLFSRLLPYMEWYASYNGEKRGIRKDYLYFGMDHEPECFDFAMLHSLTRILGDDNCVQEIVDLAPLIEYETCAFCGKRYAKGNGTIVLEDGRIMCSDCAAELVGNDKKKLRSYLLSVKRFMEVSYDVVLDEDFKVCFDSTVRIVNMLKGDHGLLRRGQDVPIKGYIDPSNDSIHVERDIPPVSLCELLVRQLTYAWQLRHLPTIPDDLSEGQIALVGVQYLRQTGETRLADLRTTYYEGNDQRSGEGYRKLVRELLKQPKYRNNSFRLLADMLGGEVPFTEDPEKPTDLGETYTPGEDESDDRTTDGAPPPFFRTRLSAPLQQIYDQMLQAALAKETEITVDGSIPFSDIERVFNAVTADHPELFYLLTGKMTQLGNVVSLYYDLTTPPEQLWAQIEAAIPAFTEGITPDMSAYDIALRLHGNLIDRIDYDTVALNEEKAEGYDKEHIDRLRSICGVFLDNSAVCASYARALQLLLHRYGIEAGYCTGMITPAHGGGGHAWIIVKLYGEYYYIDPTWDDRSDTVQVVKKLNKSYNYFCITTEELLRSRDTSLCPTDMPVCTATKCNYFYHNNAVLTEYSVEKIKTIAANAIKRGAMDFAFKCADASVYATAKQQLMVDNKDGFQILKELKKINKSINAESYSVSPCDELYILICYLKP